jgi:hypothetical protein
MSAFIVSDNCLLQVCEAIYPFAAPGWKEEEAQALLLGLADLNTDAVNYRYAHNNEPEPKCTAAELPFECIYASETQLLKAMDCWLYQCAEGDQFEQHALYRRVQAAADKLAAVIDRDGAEYDRASWGH